MMTAMASSSARWQRALLAAALAAAAVPARAVAADAATAMPAAAATTAAATPAAIDLGRYLGRWYVIARVPAREPHPRGAYYEYRAVADGGIEAIYSARHDTFDGEPRVMATTARADPQQPARWAVKSGWFGSDERWVLYVSPDYQYTIAGTPDRAAAWILAREPVIPEWSYAGLLARLALQGYDVAAFRRVPQQPEQVGRPGFE